MRRLRWVLNSALLLLPLLSFVPPQQPSGELALTAAERAWLSRHPVVRWGVVPAYAPIESVDFNSHVQGFAPDLLGYVSQTLGIQLDTVFASSWVELMRKAERGEIDLISVAARRDDPAFPFQLGEPYLTLTEVLIVRRSNEAIHSLDDMPGRTLAVGKNWAILDYLKAQFPSIVLRTVDDVDEALLATAFGEVDATVATIPNASHYIEQKGIANLQIAEPVDFDIELCFAVRKDWAPLLGILDKTVASIPADVRADLEQRWIYLEQPAPLFSAAYWRWIVASLALALVLLCGVWAWNRLLKRQVAERTRALQVAKDQAEESTRVTSNILATISHEVRTPLAAIVGFAQMLEGDVTPEDKRWMTRLITESSERLLRSLNSVLALSLIEAGAMRLRTDAFDVCAVVSSLEKEWQRKADARGLALILALPEPPHVVHLDQAAIEQILENLMQNALKFTSKGHVMLTLRDAGGHLLIEVADTGIGISAAFREKMFEPFRQESEGLRRSFEGVGLGLAILHRLVALMGGEIRVESEQGRGTHFTVQLPHETPAAHHAPLTTGP